MLRRYLWKLCGTHNIGRIKTRQEVSITAKQWVREKKQNQMCMNSLKTEDRTKCLFVVVQHFLLVCLMGGVEKKTNNPKLFFSPLPKQRVACWHGQPDGPNWTQLPYRWDREVAHAASSPRQTTKHLPCDSLLLPGTSVSEESHLVSWQPCLSSQCSGSGGADLMTEKNGKKNTGAQEWRREGLLPQDFYTSEPRSRNDLAPQVQRFIYSWGLFYTPIVARAHWNWVESNILPYSINRCQSDWFTTNSKVSCWWGKVRFVHPQAKNASVQRYYHGCGCLQARGSFLFLSQLKATWPCYHPLVTGHNIILLLVHLYP